MTAALNLTTPKLYKRGTVDYTAIDAVNWSTLKHVLRSPKHYQHVRENGIGETPSMRLGSAAHVAVLEPVRFTTEFAVYEPPEGKTARKGTKAWAEFEAANDGKILLKQAEFDAAMRIRDAVRGDPLVMRYLRKGDAECAIVWTDKETGIVLKCRLDWLSTSVPDVIGELKTAADVSPLRFPTPYARLMYHAQAAMQVDAVEALTGRPAYQKCIAVESKEPHDTVVYDVIGDVLEIGRELYRDALQKLAACRHENVWPGHGAGAEVSLRLPAWAVPDESDDLADLGLE